MNWWPFVVLFVAGAVFGAMAHALARMVDLQGINQFLDSFARVVGAPFSLLGRALRRRADLKKVRQGMREAVSPSDDPREQQISDTTQTVRNILRSIATVIQKADQAASNSTQTLGDVRNTIDQMSLPPDLIEVHGQLLAEIDRVLSSNSALKSELSHSREVLASQREQIESLKTAVRIDGLTQLANRTYFDEKLAEMVQIMERYEEPFSLMMIDVDNFKEINDTHGHRGGDRVLKGVAFKIRSALRLSDFVARFGGDEFVVILIKARARGAADVAAKLCEQVRESRFLLDGQEVKTTLSIGVAEARAGDGADELINRADAALYRAKEEGRDRVYVANSPAWGARPDSPPLGSPS